MLSFACYLLVAASTTTPTTLAATPTTPTTPANPATPANILTTLSTATPTTGGAAIEDADWPLLHAGGEERMQYYLIGPRPEAPEPPADGWRLLIVLPGGDGSADFHPFVSRIHERALPPGYLVAQAVAPVWDERMSQRIVWPTAKTRFDGVEFTSEQFVEAIIEDVVARLAEGREGAPSRLDQRHIYALAWSSSGPAVYAAAMSPESRLRGAFVAMSVFHPEALPDPAGAAGRAFYLLHSPEDFIAMDFPESAREKLRDAGAKVHLETYRGGHGWRGDVFGMIRRGVEWLEANAAEGAGA